MAGLGNLLRFLMHSGSYAKTDEDAVEEAGDGGARHARYYKCIVFVALLFTVLGGGTGIVLSVMMLQEGARGVGGRPLPLLGPPLLLAVTGLGLGVALSTLFAPTEFLEGPVGAKVKKFVGVQSVAGVRVVCALFLALILGIAAFLTR